MCGQECYFLKNEKCWRKEGKKEKKGKEKGEKIKTKQKNQRIYMPR